MEMDFSIQLFDNTQAYLLTLAIFSSFWDTNNAASLDRHSVSKRRVWNEPYFEGRPGPAQPRKAVKDPNAFFSANCKPFYMNNCMGACLSGYIVGPDGCPTCRCCVELVCEITCPMEDVVLNDDGCQTCQCKVHQNNRVNNWIEQNRDRQGSYDAVVNNRPPPRLYKPPTSRCPKHYCPQSCHFTMDANGCEVCSCKPDNGKKKPYQWEKPNMFNDPFDSVKMGTRIRV